MPVMSDFKQIEQKRQIFKLRMSLFSFAKDATIGCVLTFAAKNSAYSLILLDFKIEK